MTWQTKLIIIGAVFLSGLVAGGIGVHKWYQAEQKAAFEKLIDNHNAQMKEKSDAYKKLAVQKEKVLIKTRVIKRNIITRLPATDCYKPDDAGVRNEYAATINGFLAERGVVTLPADPVDGSEKPK